MISKWILVIVMTSTLWTICLSQNGCTSTIFNTSQIIFTCLSNATINELPLYNYTTTQLANIISIKVNGINGATPGPFTSIPPNLCLLPNLQNIDFSYNQITQVDPAAALNGCLSSTITLDLSYNNISEFPSVMIYNMPMVENLYFQHNQLIEVPSNAFVNILNLATINFSYNSLTTFELWTLLVSTSVDFSHNQISMITNKYLFNIPMITLSNQKPILLNNNSPTINLTDAIYEMYNSCDEVIDILELPGNNGSSVFPIISLNLAFINFGTTQINCSCNQAYILQMLLGTFSQLQDIAPFPIYNATCTDGTQFLTSNCAPKFAAVPPNSSVDFTRVYPRQCEILQSEGGSLTSVQNMSVPTSNASTYPHYETRLMNPGACFFTFLSTTVARIQCTNDISSSSTIPSTLLNTTYFSNITTIDFPTSISSLPSYLCSLPSRQIDLSYQSFTTLDNAVFPCLDWFYKVTLSHNNISSVNMASGNFTNLNYLDLSSNQLTTLPYSILTPTPSSLRYLDLRNNSITSIDLFLYTLKNITVDLRDNPINSSSIINPQNVTLPSGNSTNSTVTITFPSSVTSSTYIFNDQTALTAGTCTRAAVLEYLGILQMTYNNILLDCTCASINLEEIFIRGGGNIANSFNCSNGTSAANFATLTMASCGSAALNFTAGLCYNESLQTSMDETIMGALRINIQIAISSLTKLINSSNVTQNQPYASLPEFEETTLDLYRLPITTNSNQLAPVYTETTKTKNSSHPNMTSASSANSSNQMDTLFSIIKDTGSDTSSLSSTLPMMNSTAMISDSDMTISIGWTTTTTTTTTTTSSSSSTSTTTSTTSKTTSTTSTSTTTSRTTTSTSTTSTTTSVTTTSTTTSTSTTSRTTSTSSTSSTSTTTSVTTTSTTTSTSSTSQTTSTSSTSSTSTTTSVTTTSTTTSTSATSQTTSTSSTSTSASSTTSFTTTVTNTSDVLLQSSNGGSSSSSRTGLIVGLVVGLVGFFAIAGALVAVIVFKNSKGAGGMNKPVGRAAAISQAPQDALLKSRVQTRNLRSVRLAPLSGKPSKLPPLSHGSAAPVTVIKDPSTSNKTNLRASARGIPVRTDPTIRSPSNVVPEYASSSHAANDSFHFQPMNNPPSNQRSLTQQQIQKPTARRPRPSQALNTGGDTRY